MPTPCKRECITAGQVRVRVGKRITELTVRCTFCHANLTPLEKTHIQEEGGDIPIVTVVVDVDGSTAVLASCSKCRLFLTNA